MYLVPNMAIYSYIQTCIWQYLKSLPLTVRGTSAWNLYPRLQSTYMYIHVYLYTYMVLLLTGSIQSARNDCDKYLDQFRHWAWLWFVLQSSGVCSGGWLVPFRGLSSSVLCPPRFIHFDNYPGPGTRLTRYVSSGCA